MHDTSSRIVHDVTIEHIINNKMMTLMTITTDTIVAMVDARLGAMNASIKRKPIVGQWASMGSAVRRTIIKQRCQRSHGHDAMRKASATIMKNTSVTKHMQLTTAG
jgi:hypothetical protein